MTGMNAQPLGNARRWGSNGGDDQNGSQGYDMKRRADYGPPTNAQHDPNGPRKRRSRWGSTNERSDVANAAIAANVSGQELDRYAIQVRLEEISRKIRTGDVIPPVRERSPSPPPTYDANGRRINTRETRYRKKLEEERLRLVERQMRIDPSFRPPAEYQAAKRTMRPTEKVYLPVREFPEINFFGLLVGPRGNTLKKMEGQSGAKIHIRGRGSVKHGKGAGDDDEEDMHCIVTGDTDRAVKLCIKLINEVVSTAASTPETQNDHKRSQLRELAVLNGTLRDDENQVCQNCGEKGHRKFECVQERSWNNGIVCHRCGGNGHLARDCVAPGTDGGHLYTGHHTQVDSEYANLMAELGEKAGAYGAPIGADSIGGPLLTDKGEKIPPWRDPTVWNTPGSGRAGGGMQAVDQQGMYGSATMDAGWAGRNFYGGEQAWPAEQAAQPEEGQQDYSAEWAAYYAAQAAQQGAEGAAAEGEPARDYSKEWEEYYRQQALAQQAQD
ncbi:hypothetical protein MVES1_002906 [Malassezia vespertilionis]|uniref:uncharacterized protein n=1 Tax=Malassezia vespertilionis TaxID=2020962 RepID=UPI0024B1CDD0|nr:uncharacterized protein MVES1_002906 [Malassezia vespertilionis]WFD07540.1 hypothetical protein MVES1_002906 [Malassezia vespertilionis]